MIEIEIANEQTLLSIDQRRLTTAVARVMEVYDIDRGEVSVAIVDDETIHRLNREYLEHDYATDVLSFLLEDGPAGMQGQIIASADTASANAAQYGWPAQDELLLYVIHGALHLAGLDDQSPDAAAEMRAAEASILATFGLTPAAAEASEQDRNKVRGANSGGRPKATEPSSQNGRTSRGERVV